MATHSSILAWKIPQMEESHTLQAQTEALTEAMTKALSAMMASGGTTSKGPQPYMGASKESSIYTREVKFQN